MATAVPVPGPRTTAGVGLHRGVPLSVGLVAAAVLVALGLLATTSASWFPPVALGASFLAGVALLALGGDEPLTARQVAGVGSFHVLVGALLAAV